MKLTNIKKNADAKASEVEVARKYAQLMTELEVHPLLKWECARDVREAADERLSTGGMCRYARESAAKTILVGTEVGLLHRLRTENPEKTILPVSDTLVCPNMKKTTLENVAEALREMKTRVTVPEDIATRARRAIEAMLAVG